VQDQEDARANQENGPDHFDADVAESELLQLKGNPEQYQKAAPEPAGRTAMPRESIRTEVDQQERPEFKDRIGPDDSDLVEQQNDTQPEDDHPDDEMPV
jgi:hypothetical protein